MICDVEFFCAGHVVASGNGVYFDQVLVVKRDKKREVVYV